MAHGCVIVLAQACRQGIPAFCYIRTQGRRNEPTWSEPAHPYDRQPVLPRRDVWLSRSPRKEGRCKNEYQTTVGLSTPNRPASAPTPPAYGRAGTLEKVAPATGPSG